jgi:hypothetical protein
MKSDIVIRTLSKTDDNKFNFISLNKVKKNRQLSFLQLAKPAYRLTFAYFLLLQ